MWQQFNIAKNNKALVLVSMAIFCFLLIQLCYYVGDFKRIFKNMPIIDDKPRDKPIIDVKQTVKFIPIEKYKTILYWTGMFGHADFYLGYGNKIFEGCEFSNCFGTNNRSFVPVDQFDAVLFHGREYPKDNGNKPKKRSRDQYYVYLDLESPLNTPKWSGSKNFFNWTMTYRSDSDIVHLYGYYENMTTNYTPPTVEEIQQRPKKIAWMVSNCKNDQSQRNVLYEKLKKYIPIDMYGDCGKLKCPKDDFDGCHETLSKKYKFYLSFENSICRDYVTEKPYAPLLHDYVPIVYGAANYSQATPPKSVVDVTKFGSVKELADFLKYLDENPEEYLSYFQWKKYYTVTKSNHKRALCQLCEQLNKPRVHKSYADINKWWREGMCKLNNDLPHVVFTS